MSQYAFLRYCGHYDSFLFLFFTRLFIFRKFIKNANQPEDFDLVLIKIFEYLKW